MPPVRIDVVHNHSGCPKGRSWAVVGADTGKVHGCHPTKAQARRQQSAIYAAVSRRGGASMSTVTEEQVVADEIVDEEVAYEVTTERKRLPWEGILAIAGWPTSDKRYLIPGEIGHRPLPLPLAASHEDQHATETVGRIDSIQVIPASKFKKQGWDLPADLPDHAEVIWGQGSFDGSPEADDALRQIENGVGVSLDLPTERKALIDAKTYEEVEPDVALAGADPLDVLFGGVPDGYLRGFAGKIGGLSLASIAAFEETAIRPVGESALVATAGTEIRIVRETLTASAAGLAPLKPPKEWFFRPEPIHPTPLTVTEEGEVYGHLALWGQCHTSYAQCETPNRSKSGYAYFHTGQLETDEGEMVNVGRITVGEAGTARGGHADLVLGTKGAMEHYEKTGCVGAFVRALDGRQGIWLSGAVRSDAPAERVRDMRANPPSLDYRWENGCRELVAALSVPVGGFPIPRYEARLVATGGVEEVETLIMQGYIEEEEMEVSKADLRRKAVLDQARAELEWERDGFAYSAADRRRMARSGAALPDGSFPIASCSDAENAIHAQGRAGNQGRAVAHIKRRVRSLNCQGSIFDPYR